MCQLMVNVWLTLLEELVLSLVALLLLLLCCLEVAVSELVQAQLGQRHLGGGGVSNEKGGEQQAKIQTVDAEHGYVKWAWCQRDDVAACELVQAQLGQRHLGARNARNENTVS
jgi:hypothetical protein